MPPARGRERDDFASEDVNCFCVATGGIEIKCPWRLKEKVDLTLRCQHRNQTKWRAGMCAEWLVAEGQANTHTHCGLTVHPALEKKTDMVLTEESPGPRLREKDSDGAGGLGSALSAL